MCFFQLLTILSPYCPHIAAKSTLNLVNLTCTKFETGMSEKAKIWLCKLVMFYRHWYSEGRCRGLFL